MAKLPGRFLAFQKRYPQVFESYESLGKAASAAGPLDKKQIAIAKLAIACGAKMEGAVHTHTRRALEAGVTAEEVRHVALLAVTTMGFPNMMAILSWVDDVIDKESESAS